MALGGRKGVRWSRLLINFAVSPSVSRTVFEYFGAALGSGVFSILIGYGLFKALRVRRVLSPLLAGLLATVGSTVSVAFVTSASGTSDPISWLAAVAAPGAVVGAGIAWRRER